MMKVLLFTMLFSTQSYAFFTSIDPRLENDNLELSLSKEIGRGCNQHFQVVAVSIRKLGEHHNQVDLKTNHISNSLFRNICHVVDARGKLTLQLGEMLPKRPFNADFPEEKINFVMDGEQAGEYRLSHEGIFLINTNDVNLE